MKERPILFSAPMVTAILNGSKTQTRRIVKPQPTMTENGCPRWGTYDGRKMHMVPRRAAGGSAVTMTDLIGESCPYGQPGAHLWVRETWNCIDTGRLTQRQDWVRYRATDGEEMYWRPSIFMPRWASRITLEVTGVRVERVQDISEEDATAEGAVATKAGDNYPFAMSARMNFVDLWDDINAKRGFGWADNPYVWIVEFKRHQ